MTSIEKTGKNVEEATQLALEQLGVTEDEVDVEIMEEGSKGFLGIGQSHAKVCVTLKDPHAARKTRPIPSEEPAKMETPKPAPAAPEVTRRPATKTEAKVEEGSKRAAEIAQELLQDILERMGDKARVVIRNEDDSQVTLDMIGGETSVLIGKHGQTINALQYLVGIITNRHVQGQVRMVLDAEGYRSRREDMLKQQALVLAAKVKETGQEAVLDPLQAHERRIVHMALANDEDVETYSEGDEPERYVVISPRK